MINARKNVVNILFALILLAALSLAAPAGVDAADPVISLTPSSGPIGTKVTVSVCNMTPGNTVIVGNITFNGSPWNTQEVQVDSAGCMCASMLTVPVAPVGPNGITISDGSMVATGVFTIKQPNVTISPTSGYKGGTVTVEGTGWVSNTAVTLTFEGSVFDTLIPDSTGNFETEFVVPLTASDSNVIGASDNIGNSGPAVLFTLKPPGITVSPLSGYAGTIVQLLGWGFEPFTSVENLRIAGTAIPAPGLMTDHMGTFITTFEAPSLPEGGYVVTATVAGETLDACFTIIEEDVWDDVGEDFPTPIETALATISDRVIRVWCYHNAEWQMYDPDDPLGSNLAGMVRGRAYWIKVSEGCTLIFRDLQEGWNNIGW